ncbi:MAG: hypothetical protein SGJ24_17935 [Chloroflexota bacterium]|nr:hypothetical protein [Chloroflexota bacterium]
MTQATTSTRSVDRRRSRRPFPWSIALPFGGGVAVIVVLVIVALISGRSAPVADIFLTLVILCPLVICMLPIYILFVVLIGLMTRANRGLNGGLRRVGKAVDSVEDGALALTGRAARWTIGLNSAFARYEKLAHRIINPHHPADKP